MIFSYSLGSSVRSEDVYSLRSEETGNKYLSEDFDSGNRNKEVVKSHLEKYGDVSPSQINVFSGLIEKFNMNPNMLVAADQWYKNNDYPEKFSIRLFDNNFAIKQITSLSFESKKDWGFDRKISLLTYASFLKENLYKTGQNEIVLSIGSEGSGFYDSYDESDGF